MIYNMWSLKESRTFQSCCVMHNIEMECNLKEETLNVNLMYAVYDVRSPKSNIPS